MSYSNRTALAKLVGVLLVIAAAFSPPMIGRATAPAGQFTNNGNGTVTDNFTGLIWQQALQPNTYTYATAVSYCAGLTLGGNSNWRLPEIAEIQSTYDACSTNNPRVDTTYFPGTTPNWVWSNTVDAQNSANAWTLGNNSYPATKTMTGSVRCVR